MRGSFIKIDNKARRRGRIRAKISGTPLRPRLCVFRSNRGLYAQVIDDTIGKTIASFTSLKLPFKSKKTMEAAKTVGLEVAKAAKAKKITSVVFDRAGFAYTGKIKAIAEGAREGGLKF